MFWVPPQGEVDAAIASNEIRLRQDKQRMELETLLHGDAPIERIGVFRRVLRVLRLRR